MRSGREEAEAAEDLQYLCDRGILLRMPVGGCQFVHHIGVPDQWGSPLDLDGRPALVMTSNGTFEPRVIYVRGFVPALSDPPSAAGPPGGTTSRTPAPTPRRRRPRRPR